jgi:antitoxin CptB
METSETAHLDARRKQLLYRASHRGIKEMDIILGGFAAAHLAALDDAALDTLEALMAESDRDLLTWFTGEVPAPAHVRTALFDAIVAHQAASVA